MPQILSRFREVKHGTPANLFDSFDHDENYRFSEEDEQKASDLWDVEIDKMIAGFVAHKKILDIDYDYKNDSELRSLQEVYRLGMNSFVEHFGSLWD
jgi:hypothetical protein